MFEAISHAQKSIYLEMYIFQKDMAEFDFFRLLQEKAKAGLRVKLLLDSYGSSDFYNEAVPELEQAGVEILYVSYLLHRTHRKILIVDEQVAFIGGVNFHKASRFWNDLMVRITGNLVARVVMSFAKSYIFAGGKDPILLGKDEKINFKKKNIRIEEHSPVRKNFHFKKIYKKYLNGAKSGITLITPYFMPKRWLSAALHQAVLRGVKVEVLVPENTDHFFSNRLNSFYIYKLSKLGIKFYMEKKMNHAKAIIIDEKEAMVGSQNLDFFSFDFNSEIGVFFKDKEVVSKLLEIVKEWKKGAVLFDSQRSKPKWFDYILSPIINLFNLFSNIF